MGLNSVRLAREGSTIYGSATTATSYPDTRKTSPYAGLTYEVTPSVLAYASFSEIYQNQDQQDIDGVYLDPMKGINGEVGVKTDWLEKRLLTTLALFTAKQQGLATYAGMTLGGQYYYVPKDVQSRGFEVEANGRLGEDTHLGLGFTHLKLTGPDGQDIYEWIPRSTLKLRLDSRVPGVAALRMGAAARWQSEVSKTGGARQDAYLVADAFATYRFSDHVTARLNINNLFDKNYVTGIAYGALYGQPRSAFMSVECAF